MNNNIVKKNNYIKFSHASHCNCNACLLRSFNVQIDEQKGCVDYFDPEDLKDDDGWYQP